MWHLVTRCLVRLPLSLSHFTSSSSWQNLIFLTSAHHIPLQPIHFSQTSTRNSFMKLKLNLRTKKNEEDIKYFVVLVKRDGIFSAMIYGLWFWYVWNPFLHIEASENFPIYFNNRDGAMPGTMENGNIREKGDGEIKSNIWMEFRIFTLKSMFLLRFWSFFMKFLRIRI